VGAAAARDGRAAGVTDDAAGAWRRLARREDVALAASCAHPRERVRAVGGAVRDAFLGRAGGDLDLAVEPGRAAAFAERLAARARSRVVPVGAAPRRILKVPFHGREIDVWEEEGGPEGDLLRRDFTVNAIAFDLPSGALVAAPHALDDLRKKVLRAPRPGVFLEDPLRVLRAARFLAQLPGFRVARSAELEMKRAGRFLRMVSEERRLVELDKLLAAPPKDRDRALRFLERVGALRTLIRSSAPRMRRGISLVGRLQSRDPRVARVLLLLPQGPKRSEELLREWKTSREEQRLASRLFALPLRVRGIGGRGAPRARGAPLPATRREVAELLRLSSPFEEESLSFLLAAGDSRVKGLARAAEAVRRRPASLRRILKPARPLPLEEIRDALSLADGPQLGAALSDFDLALASGEIRGARAARKWLAARAGLGKRPPRLVP
jgi:tRNA nucleotidyltransferase/poly(A) polymerase